MFINRKFILGVLMFSGVCEGTASRHRPAGQQEIVTKIIPLSTEPHVGTNLQVRPSDMSLQSLAGYRFGAIVS